MLIVLVFFFKQKTAYEMRISDWSSDVCSSDLSIAFVNMFEQAGNVRISRHAVVFCFGVLVSVGLMLDFMEHLATALKAMGIFLKIGRASCRARVCQYV